MLVLPLWSCLRDKKLLILIVFGAAILHVPSFVDSYYVGLLL